LINQRNVLRQIRDIQVQADRLIKNKADLIEIENFAKYAYELRTYLTTHIKDEFILKYVNEVPILDLNEKSEINDIVRLLFRVFGGVFGAYSIYREQKKRSKALETIKNIKNKYASAEFMLKNYFE